MAAVETRTYTLTLTGHEILAAGHAGLCRAVTAIRDGRPLEEGRKDDGFERHIHGAIAEYAYAKYLGLCWSPAVGVLDTEWGDLPGVHVKSTTRRDGSLIVRPHDPPTFPYALAILALPKVHLVGWMDGIEARQPNYWRDVDTARGIHRAAYFVPQVDLQPVSRLKDLE